MGLGMSSFNFTSDFHQPGELHKCGPTDPQDLCNMSRVFTFLVGYIFPPVAAFGVPANFFAIFIFLFRQERKRLNIYLAFLAFCDNLCIIVYGWLWYFPAKTLPYVSNQRLYFYPWNHGVLICKFHRFGMAFVSTMSTTAQLLITIDRCLSIYFPLRFANASNKRAWYGMAAVTLISLFLSAPYFYLMGYSLTSEGQRVCYFADSNNYFWQVTNVLFNNCGLVQVCLMILVNSLLTVRLIKYRKDRASLTEGAKTLPSSEVSASMVLVILSIIMIVGSLPQMIGQTMAMIVVNDPVLVLFAYTMFDTGSTIFFIQQSVNFVVYFTRMADFRRAALACFCIKSKAGQSGSSYADTRASVLAG